MVISRRSPPRCRIPGIAYGPGFFDADQADAVCERLFADDLWSGWGVRTLSADNPAYNPLSYQRGSVWPHDNGIIAEVLCRYGRRKLANRIARGIFDAAAAFEQFRLPELFAGLPRNAHLFPVQDRHANVPQAWAAGSVFHLLRSVLGIDADVPNGRIYTVESILTPRCPNGSTRSRSIKPKTEFARCVQP